MKRICVFCGSSIGANPEYLDAARQLGTMLADNDIGLVFGGGKVGLMGVVARAASENGELKLVDFDIRATIAAAIRRRHTGAVFDDAETRAIARERG